MRKVCLAVLMNHERLNEKACAEGVLMWLFVGTSKCASF